MAEVDETTTTTTEVLETTTTTTEVSVAEEAAKAGLDNVVEPANDPVLGEDGKTDDENVAQGQADAMANSQAEHADDEA